MTRAMNNVKLLSATLLIIAIFFAGCSTGRSQKDVAGLLFISKGKAYQVRVRTGNIAVDRAIYLFAYSEFGRYLPVSEKGPFTGYIDITFVSEENKLFRGSSEGYLTNVEYGDNWYTGGIDADSVSRLMGSETNIAPGGLLAWQDSFMFVTIRKTDGRKLWRAEYNYRGSRDLSALFMSTADEAAKVCLGRIIHRFEIDYGLEAKLTAKEKKQLPQIALIIKKRPEKSKWKDAGKNAEGASVFIDSEAISYPDAGIVRTTVNTAGSDKNLVELYEIDCPQKKFRILDRHFHKEPSSSPYTTQWTLVPYKSTQELIFNYVCKKIKQNLNTDGTGDK